MPISDYGVNTYGLTIVSNPDFMQQKPEVVKAFMKATLRSVAETIKDPGSRGRRGRGGGCRDRRQARGQGAGSHVAVLAEQGDRHREASAGRPSERWRDTIDVARKLGLIETALKTEDVFVNTYLGK